MAGQGLWPGPLLLTAEVAGGTGAACTVCLLDWGKEGAHPDFRKWPREALDWKEAVGTSVRWLMGGKHWCSVK